MASKHIFSKGLDIGNYDGPKIRTEHRHRCAASCRSTTQHRFSLKTCVSDVLVETIVLTLRNGKIAFFCRGTKSESRSHLQAMFINKCRLCWLTGGGTLNDRNTVEENDDRTTVSIEQATTRP